MGAKPPSLLCCHVQPLSVLWTGSIVARESSSAPSSYTGRPGPCQPQGFLAEQRARASCGAFACAGSPFCAGTPYCAGTPLLMGRSCCRRQSRSPAPAGMPVFVPKVLHGSLWGSSTTWMDGWFQHSGDGCHLSTGAQPLHGALQQQTCCPREGLFCKCTPICFGLGMSFTCELLRIGGLLPLCALLCICSCWDSLFPCLKCLSEQSTLACRRVPNASD